jgi:hypothetical protein
MSQRLVAVAVVLAILTISQTAFVHPSVLNHALAWQGWNQQIAGGLTLLGFLLVCMSAGETSALASRVRA